MSGKVLTLFVATILFHLGAGFWAILHSGSPMAQAVLGIPCIFAAGLETAFLIVASNRRLRPTPSD